VDAKRVERCKNATTCSVTISPTNHAFVHYAAALVDTYGNITTTGYKLMKKR
jgi:hypothetical protein